MNDRGSGMSSNESNNYPGIRRVATYTSSAVQHPRSSLTQVRMYAEEEHEEGFYLLCGGGDRHESGLKLAVETFDKSIGCRVVSRGTYPC